VTPAAIFETRGQLSQSPFEGHLPVAKVPINDPKHWRKRAEDARTIADSTTDDQSKKTMLRIAEDYEQLARRAERRLKQQRQQQQQQQQPTGNGSGTAHRAK
jgi:hypothetical protein